MKELSIEQKAIAYDAAVKEASIAYKDEDRHLKATLERIFPGLKESEDERMREMAIKAVYAPQAQSCIKSWGINPDDVITWLEKQSEKKSYIDTVESGDEKIMKELIMFIKKRDRSGCDYDYDKWIAWLEKQNKRPIWTDNDRIMAFTLLRDIDQMTHISNEGKNERLEWLNALENRFKED